MSPAPLSKPLYDRADFLKQFLPIDKMQQIDRVLTIDGAAIVAEMDLPTHWVFPIHFPGDPIFPASLLIEAAGQVVAIYAWHSGLRGKPRLTKTGGKFSSPIRPEDGLLTFRGTVRKRQFLCAGVVEIFAGERLAAEVTATIAVV